MKTNIMKKLSSTMLAAALTCAVPALAGPDNVGLGKVPTSQDGKDVVKLSDANNPINSYAAVQGLLSVDTGQIKVKTAEAKPFGKGDLVLVLQTTGSASAANGTEPRMGTWEFARISGKQEQQQGKDASLTVLTLEEPLEHSYAAGHTQIIRVAEYGSVEVTGTLSADEWNGRTGGVLAMLVNGTLTIKDGASISATGRGFRGEGNVRSGTPNDLHGGTGGANAGGGGGGNAGAGGTGGSSAQLVAVDNGGHKLGYTPQASTFGGRPLLLGGGGGAGMSRSGPRAGGNGGGIVFIRANVLEAEGSIQAEGTKGEGDTQVWGTGSGAGAGGTVYLRIAGSSDCSGGVKVAGGVGGDAYDNMSPGGGGAGGWLLIQKGKDGTCTAMEDDVAGRNAGNPGKGVSNAKRGGPGTLTDVNRSLKAGFPVLETPLVQTPVRDSRTNDNAPLYTGTMDIQSEQVEGTQVHVMVDDQELGSTTPSAYGKWSLDRSSYSKESLPDGERKVEVVAINQLQGVQSRKGKMAFTVDTVPPKVTVQVLPRDSWTNNYQPEFTGIASDDGPRPQVVVIRVDGGAEVTVPVNDDNTWSYKSPMPMDPGPHTVTVMATDLAGNSADTGDITVPVNAPERNLVGGGVGCAASGGTPSALAMMGLSVLSTLLARRRRR